MRHRFLSRRNFMRYAVGATPAKISSILVQIKPALYEQAVKKIAALSGIAIEWANRENNKLVLLLETDSDMAMFSRLQQIAAIPGVITADLTYSYNGHG